MKKLFLFLSLILIGLVTIYFQSEKKNRQFFLLNKYYNIKNDISSTNILRYRQKEQKEITFLEDCTSFDENGTLSRIYVKVNSSDTTKINHSYTFYLESKKSVFMKLEIGEDIYDYKVFDTLLYNKDLKNSNVSYKEEIKRYETKWPPSDYRDTVLRMYRTALKKVNIELSNPLIKEHWVKEYYDKLFTKNIEHNIATNFLSNTDIVASKIVYKSDDTYDIFIYSYLSGSKNSYYQLSFRKGFIIRISEYIDGELIDDLNF